jgi:hypothetical protein
VTDQEDTRPTDPVFFGQEIAAQQRLNSEQGKEIGRDSAANDPLRGFTAGEIDIIAGVSSDVRQRLILFFPLQKLRACDAIASSDDEAARRQHLPDLYKPLWRGVRERTDQDCIHNAENRGVRSNSEGQSDDGDGRKTGILHQHAQTIAEVV